MKQVYVLAGALLMASSSLFAQSNNFRHVAKTQTRTLNENSARPMEEQGLKAAPVWTNDFSNAADWTTADNAGSGDNWLIGMTVPSGAFAIDGIASTTAANGFAMYDSDLMCSGNQDADVVTAAPIDLTGHTNLTLQFESFYREYQGTVYVVISTDGTTWIEKQVHVGLGVNNSTDNPTMVMLDISEIAGSATGYVGFRYKGGCDYAWMVDDLAIIPTPDHDIALTQFLFGYGETAVYDSIRVDQYPSMIPRKQSRKDTIQLGAMVGNNGLATQNDVTVDFSVTGSGTWNSSSASASLAPGDTTGFMSPDSYVAMDYGTYTTSFSTQSENADENAGDNMVSFSREVTDTTYAHDNKDGFSNTVFWYGPDNPTYEIGNFFDFWDDDVATSCSWYYYDQCTPGQFVEFKLYEVTAPVAIPLSLSAPLATANYTLDANDAGQFLTFKFDNPVNVNANGRYWLSITTYMGSSDTLWTVHDDGSDVVNSWVIINGDAANAGWPGSNCWLRLNTESSMDACGDMAINLQSVDNVSCAGDGNGAVNLNAAGTVGTPYTFAWSNGGADTSITNVAGGVYTLSVTNQDASCTNTYSYTVTEPAAITVTGVVTDETCGTMDGAIDVTVAGGTAPFTYLWTGGGTDEDAMGLGQGSYTVDVTDANGCAGTTTEVVGGTNAVMVTVTAASPSACATPDGTATAVASDGVSTGYTYAWSNAGATSMITGLAVGTYDVTATASTGCMAWGTVNVNDAGAQTVSLALTNLNCNGDASGTATATVTGGTTPYSYDWGSGAVTSNMASGLSAGSVSLVVTDAAGCIALDGGDITEPTVLNTTFTSSDVACNGATTGSASVMAEGGTTPYSYDWGAGATATWSSTALAAGVVSITTSDANGCSVVDGATLTEPSAISLTTTGTNIVCNGDQTGSVMTTVAGGVTPYTYSWNPSQAGATNATNVGAGAYTVDVTDGNGCVASATETLTEPASAVSVNVTTTLASDIGQTDGAAGAVATGGAGSYTYLWSNAATSQEITNVAAGAYTVVVTDADGCTGTAQGTVLVDAITEFGTDATMSIFPNPTTAKLNINLENVNTDVYTVEISNILGQNVYNTQVAVSGSKVLSMDLTSWDKGVYFVSVSNDTAKETVRVILK